MEGKSDTATLMVFSDHDGICLSRYYAPSLTSATTMTSFFVALPFEMRNPFIGVLPRRMWSWSGAVVPLRVAAGCAEAPFAVDGFGEGDNGLRFHRSAEQEEGGFFHEGGKFLILIVVSFGRFNFERGFLLA